MIIRTRLTLLVPALLLTCCSTSGPMERKIAARIKSCSATSPCRIVMAEITDFQWDRMYAFKYVATLQQVQEALGTAPPQYTEFTRKIVFLNHGAVVYMEEDPTDVEHPVAGQVIFDIPDTAAYRVYDRETAVFLARKKENLKDDVYYELDSAQ